jgi:hypothetical protein
VGYL